jgi:hypothetical protein
LLLAVAEPTNRRRFMAQMTADGPDGTVDCRDDTVLLLLLLELLLILLEALLSSLLFTAASNYPILRIFDTSKVV